MSNWRLIADIGGSTLRMACAGAKETVSAVTSKRLSAQVDLVGELRAFAAVKGGSVTGVAIAAAGPVEGQRIALTNRHLVIDAAEIGAAFGAPVDLYNDLQAAALALPWLSGDEVRPLFQAENAIEGPRLIAKACPGVDDQSRALDSVFRLEQALAPPFCWPWVRVGTRCPANRDT